MRIIGIDPGLRLTGYGCVEVRPGRWDPQLVEAGVIRLDGREAVASRLVELFADLGSILDQLAPQRIAVEKLYAHYAHPATAIKMGHARGVILLAARQRHLELVEVGATEVKKSLTGNGHAAKRQIQVAVQAQCRLSERPSPPDVADAIAIALCAARRGAAARVAALA